MQCVYYKLIILCICVCDCAENLFTRTAHLHLNSFKTFKEFPETMLSCWGPSWLLVSVLDVALQVGCCGPPLIGWDEMFTLDSSPTGSSKMFSLGCTAVWRCSRLDLEIMLNSLARLLTAFFIFFGGISSTNCAFGFPLGVQYHAASLPWFHLLGLHEFPG